MADDHSTQKIVTATLLGTRPAAHPDGTAALVLRTAEFGTIAFEVKLPTVQALIGQLVELQTFLTQKAGRA